MARIRTIKPEFFRHEALFEAERDTGLPLRVAFAGLWTACDREGRFRWAPRQLKLDCLPYDDIDFSRVLDALATRGFVVRYEVEGEEFGAIPSWSKHQVINNRERKSVIPPYNNINELTREERVSDASSTRLEMDQGEGKGKGNIGNGTRDSDASATRDFDKFWDAYPRRDVDEQRPEAAKRFAELLRSGIPARLIIMAAAKYADEMRAKGTVGTRFVAMAHRWLSNERWASVELLSSASAPEKTEPSRRDWDAAVGRWKANRSQWPRWGGNEPGSPSCRCPSEVLLENGVDPSTGRLVCVEAPHDAAGA